MQRGFRLASAFPATPAFTLPRCLRCVVAAEGVLTMYTLAHIDHHNLRSCS